MTTQSEPPSPRFVIESPKPALDAARLAPPSAHQRLQTHWQHSSFDVEGTLWPVPSSGSLALRFSFRLWGPEDSHVFEFLGAQPARAVRNELLRVAGLAGRPRVFAASLGLTTTQVHLVMASSTQVSATVLFDAGFEVWCADVPRHISATHLLSIACDLASTDALQLNTEISLPLRHGDVLPVRLEANQLQVDLSRHVLARPAESAAVWLDPVQSFYLLTFSRGVQGFQLAVSSDVQTSLLRGLLPLEEGKGGTFLELPSRASLPLRLFVHCRQGNDHVVFRVSEASDPADTGFFFLFSGIFDTYSDFARRLGQLQTVEARWLRALRSYGLQVTTWESMELTRSVGSSFWYVHLQADIIRAQLHFAQARAAPASFHQVPPHTATQRPKPHTEKATQTIAGPGGFPHEIAVWQTPPQPTHCEPGVFPEVSSTLADVWCDAWHIKCLIPCIPEYQAWVLRDGNRLIGLCTADITWDLVSQALHISTWELPQTFVHGDGLLLPYPEPLHQAKDKCLSVSHDTPEAVHCLRQISQNRRQSVQPARSPAVRWSPTPLGLVAGLCARRLWFCFSLGGFLVLPGTFGVMLDDVIADAAADPAPEPLPFRDYMDLTRTCTMSWTHELSRQTLGFSVRAQILGEHLQRIAPAPEILLNLWRPGRGPTMLQVRPRRLALHLASFLRALGYVEGIDSLHIAYDTSPHILDLVLVPPTGGTWWILQDSTGRELLRPIVRHHTSAVHFRLLTVSPDQIAQTVCPAYGVQQQPLLPQGARGRVIRDLPELYGSLCQGILGFAAAAGIRRGLAMFSLVFLVYGTLGADAVVQAATSTLSLATAGAPANPGPHTLRIWTVGVKKPVDLPWKPEGYNTRWLHDFICSIHGVQGAGQFLSTTGAAGDSVMHLLFVPRLHGSPAGQPRFWLFHVEDRASVVYGHCPFDWAIAATHLHEIYQGLHVPQSRPTLVIGSQLVAPSCHLSDVPSGSIVQIPIGALPMESSDDAWEPTPWVVPGPFFQYVPARGPAGEAAISPAQQTLPEVAPAAPSRCEVACQTETLLSVDTPLLSAQVVGDLALQLQGMAERLLSLPFASVEDHMHSSQPSMPSQPSAPVFCGPPTESFSEQEVPEVEPCEQEDVTASALAPSEVSSVSPRRLCRRRAVLPCILGMSILPKRAAPRVFIGLLAYVTLFQGVSGSYFTPDVSGSEDDDIHSADVPEGHRPGDGPHMRPAGPPPPTPAGAADDPDPADARLVYNETMPPDLNFLPGSMRNVHVTRRFPDPVVIRWVQNRLIRHQHGLLPATAFLNGPIPQGTPFRFHNPFTARAQCHEVGYQEPEHIPPLGVLQAHADNRGWRGVVLLNPQPDSAAVHLIALPQHGHLVSIALLVNNRVVPCCVPRRARWRDLRGITFEGVHGRLDLPQHLDVVHDTVTFRSGDCFRVDTEQEHTAASEYARLEDVDHEAAEGALHHPPAEASCGCRPRPALLGFLGGVVVAFRKPLFWLGVMGIGVSCAMHRPGGFPWQAPAHTRAFRLPDSEAQVQVLYYSPFLGTFPAYWATSGTDQSTVWAQFLNDDAAWATDFFPVWPGLHFNAFAFVPVGGDPSTVTVILHYRGFGRAVLIPRTVTDSWLQTFVSQQVSADIEDIFLPHALEAWRFYDVPPPDYRLRHGDVIYLRDREQGRDPLEAEEPWDIQTSGTGQHAPWAVGFRLDSDTVVDLLQPSQRPVLVSVPAGETWAPVQCTFSGAFHLQHQGMWTPVQWTASSVPQLMLISGVAAEANIVVASPAGRRVRAVPRYVSRDSLAACTGLCHASLVLGGVPAASLDAGVEIRNGDVVFGEPVTGSSSSVRPFPLLISIVLAAHVSTCQWLLGISLLASVGAMQQPLAFSFNAYRVGRFPWREDDPQADLAPLSSHDAVDTVYLSPFSGPGQVVTLPTTFSVSAWSEALVQQDPFWGAIACPVWPTVSAGAMVAVPRPPTLNLVCVHVTSHLEHFALCIPRVTTVAWLVGALRTARVLDVLSLRIPPALGQSPGDSQDEIAWRTGDLVVAWPPDAFTGLFQTPVFTRAEQLRHCAIWSLDFCLAAKSDAVIWQPDTRPLLTTIPRGSRWSALDATFEGVFSDRYPGSWTPVPWIAEDRPHLIQIAASDRFVHVVVETPAACFCTAVHMYTDRRQLRADLPTLDGMPRVLSVPDEELQAGTTLRDGDVVVEVPSCGSHRCLIGWGLFGLAVGGRSPGWFWVGGVGLFFCRCNVVLPCAASNHDAPSPDSSEARTIRSRIGRGRRSRSRSQPGPQPSFSFFPLDARRAIVSPPVPLHLWHPAPPESGKCFEDFVGNQGELTVRTLCPFAGTSGCQRVSVESSWDQVVTASHAHCGRWADSFIPVRGFGAGGSLTVLPVSPSPFASVVILRRGVSHAVLVPRFATLHSFTSPPAVGSLGGTTPTGLLPRGSTAVIGDGPSSFGMGIALVFPRTLPARIGMQRSGLSTVTHRLPLPGHPGPYPLLSS
ncbi:unnamed protein product [Symbiodinium necroappetens]|uniref:Uncharacterized protein n=1 Tax=Symbiodinium necroappetens TaxID=1628268 RepID=A0A813AKC1_9DINO|nr:unnamed protein product [Symbiodinium necroappetens]